MPPPAPRREIAAQARQLQNALHHIGLPRLVSSDEQSLIQKFADEHSEPVQPPYPLEWTRSRLKLRGVVQSWKRQATILIRKEETPSPSKTTNAAVRRNPRRPRSRLSENRTDPSSYLPGPLPQSTPHQPVTDLQTSVHQPNTTHLPSSCDRPATTQPITVAPEQATQGQSLMKTIPSQASAIKSQTPEALPQSTDPAMTSIPVGSAGNDRPLTVQAVSVLLAGACYSMRRNARKDMAVLLETAMKQSREAPAAQPASNGQSATLRPKDIGVFNPSLKDPTGGGIVFDTGKMIYTCVFPFTDRLVYLARSGSEEAVRKSWTQCLQGQALVWHTHILTEDERQELKEMSMPDLCQTLVNRFKEHDYVAMERLHQARFSLLDVCQGKDIYSFVQTTIRDTRICNHNVPGQLTATYKAFDKAIQALIPEPTDRTTVNEFFNNIRAKDSVIRQKASKTLLAPKIRISY